MQGACATPPELPIFTDPSLLRENQCVLQVPFRGLTVASAGSNHWIENIAFQMHHPEGSLGTPRTLVAAEGQDGHLWMHDVHFLGDDGVTQALRADNNMRVYVSGAPPSTRALRLRRTVGQRAPAPGPGSRALRLLLWCLDVHLPLCLL